MHKLEFIRHQMFKGREFNLMVQYPYPQKHYVSIVKHMGFRKVIKAPKNTLFLLDPETPYITKNELHEMIEYDKISLENQFDSEYDLY